MLIIRLLTTVLLYILGVLLFFILGFAIAEFILR